MLLPSPPAAPLGAATRFQATAQGCGEAPFSSRRSHRPPWPPLSRAATIRAVPMDASTQVHWCAACVSPAGGAIAGPGEGAGGLGCLSFPLPSPPSSPPSRGPVVLPALCRRSPHAPVGICLCAPFAAWFPGGATVSTPSHVPPTTYGTLRARTPEACSLPLQVSLHPASDRPLVPPPIT
jgi:hypothetical protein